MGRCTRPALLEDTESRDVGGEIGDGIVGRPHVEGVGEMGQATIDHLEREGGERLAQARGDVVGEIDQDGVEDQMAQTYVWMPLAAPTQK